MILNLKPNPYKAYLKPVALIYFFGYIINLFTQSKSVSFAEFLALGNSWEALEAKPWTILTYNLVHKDFFHVLLNTFLFYQTGKLFLKQFTKPMFWAIYVLGTITGGLFFILFSTYITETSPYLLGASAGIFTIIAAYVYYQPYQQISVFLKMNYLKVALYIFFISLFSSLISRNYGGLASHIGGISLGILYIIQFNNGDFIGRILTLFNPVKENKKFTSNSKQKAAPFTFIESSTEKRLNHILEKVQQHGYESLTKEEKTFLAKNS